MPSKLPVTTPAMRAKRQLVLQQRVEALQTMLLEAHEELRRLDAAMDDGIENGRPDMLELARKEA